MNPESNRENNTWESWLQRRAEATPGEDALERMNHAIEEAIAGGESADAVSPPRPASLAATNWQSKLQELTERSWGRVTLCGASLLLGLTPYVGAMILLNRQG